MENAIEIKNLVKEYDGFKLDNISTTIKKGTIVGLIGENGAGKSTLIKCILGIITKNSGDIKVNYRDKIGVVLDNMFFPELLFVNDLKIIGSNMFAKWDSKKFSQYLTDFKLPNKQIKTLSKGMRKKLELAFALSHNPDLLILDEPTSGLDPVVRSEILDIFLDFIQDPNHTILLSTHITSDLEHIADYITFIDNGKLMFSSELSVILDNYGILKCNIDEFTSIDKKDIIRYKKNKYNYEILVDDRKKISKKYKNCVVDKSTLDDIMVLYVKGGK